MVGWFSGRKKQEQDAKSILDASVDAVSTLGELMEKFPGSVLDSSMLPLPKPQMKAALKVLWTAFPAQRDTFEVGYLYLANFQDGVGPQPVSLNLPNTSEPKQIVASLESTMPWINKTTAEMQELQRELAVFKSG